MKQLQTLLKNKNLYNGDIDGIVGSKTLNGTKEYIIQEFKKRNWVLPTTDLVYLRFDYTLTDTFDDVVVRFNNGVVDMIAPCSTTAGKYYILNPITYAGVKGTAIAKEQQILNCHRFVTSTNWKSLWLGGPYFNQDKAIEIYRDGNMDEKLDKGILQKGLFGINLHRGGLGNRNWNWSAGCLVTPDAYWWQLINIFKNGQYINFNLLECII